MQLSASIAEASEKDQYHQIKGVGAKHIGAGKGKDGYQGQSESNFSKKKA